MHGTIADKRIKLQSTFTVRQHGCIWRRDEKAASSQPLRLFEFIPLSFSDFTGSRSVTEISVSALDCEQSLFSSDLGNGSARARALSGEAARREKRGRLQARAWSFACLGRFVRRSEKKERLLVV